MKVCYHMQTHKLPEQVFRLCRLIKSQNPSSLILISHDVTRSSLDVAALERMPDVHVLLSSGGYGDFSHVDRYLEAVDWLVDHEIDFDWVENLTGQAYPVLPLERINEVLESAAVDGFIAHSPVFSTDVLTTPRDARDRYLYRHRRFGRPTARKQRWLRPVMAVNFAQPLMRFSTSFSTVGVRRRKTPFTDDFVCYGGSFFCTLSRDCVLYIRQFARDHPDITEFFRRCCAPDEVFFHTVLVNSGMFRLENDSKRYVDWTNSRHNHPHILGGEDFEKIVTSGAHWAHSFDVTHDSRILDLLDDHSLERTGP